MIKFFKCLQSVKSVFQYNNVKISFCNHHKRCLIFIKERKLLSTKVYLIVYWTQIIDRDKSECGLVYDPLENTLAI